MPAGGRGRRDGGRRDAPTDPRLSGDGFLRRRLVVEEVELDVVVAFCHSGSSPFGPDHCNPSSGAVKDIAHAWPKRWSSAARVGRPFPRASSSSAVTARSGRWAAAAPARSGSRGTSGPGRTSRSRSSRAKAKQARARSARPARPPSSAIPAACAPTRSHATREHVYIAYEYVPGRTLREATAKRGADGRRRDRGRRADPRRARTRAREGHRPPRRQAGERPAGGRAGDRDPPARLRARPLRRGGDAHGRRRRARDARVHLARAPARRSRPPPPRDVWAVGVLLWEALAGRHPFWAASLLDDVEEDRGRSASARESAP